MRLLRRGQAFVSVRLRETGRRLVFCAHHYGRVERLLVELVDAVRVQRDEVLP